MSNINEEISQLINSSKLSLERRDLIRDFLSAAVDSDSAINIRLGDSNWGALEIISESRSIARVFTKSGKIQIYNFLPTSMNNPYGENVSLNNLGQWVFIIKNELEMDRLLRCLSENIAYLRSKKMIRPSRPQNSNSSVYPLTGKVSRRLRFTVLVRDNFTCQYCGRRPPDIVLHVDHREPVSLGGVNSLENLVTACDICNLGKSNKFIT